MSLDLSPIQSSTPTPHEGTRHQAPSAAPPIHSGADPSSPAITPAQLQAMTRDMQKVSEAFNRRLSFSVNEKLGQVVVKVIDLDTDKVVREIPPVELQRVYERIREVIGLLFDKKA